MQSRIRQVMLSQWIHKYIVERYRHNLNCLKNKLATLHYLHNIFDRGTISKSFHVI